MRFSELNKFIIIVIISTGFANTVHVQGCRKHPISLFCQEFAKQPEKAEVTHPQNK